MLDKEKALGQQEIATLPIPVLNAKPFLQALLEPRLGHVQQELAVIHIVGNMDPYNPSGRHGWFKPSFHWRLFAARFGESITELTLRKTDFPCP
jgi:hypothetical protein